MRKQIICVIPARYNSHRFPAKILAPLGSLPLLVRTYHAAQKTALFDKIICAIDDIRTAQVLNAHKIPYVMTDPSLPSGTFRVAAVQQMGVEKASIWVNWQADEPLINLQMVKDLLQSIDEKSSVETWTLKVKISYKKACSPHIVKVVCDRAERALYFSRSVIPFYREDSKQNALYFKHIGLYAYTAHFLKEITSLPASPLAEGEMLEQLGYLWHGYSIQVHTTAHDTIGVDVPDDLEKIQRYFASTRKSEHART